MTVSQLIALLSTMPADAEVGLYNENSGHVVRLLNPPVSLETEEGAFVCLEGDDGYAIEVL
jgi:hypothetical protein